MPKTSPARRLARRDAILCAARRVLVKSSFSDVTLASIADEAGVAKGTLFLYFTGKEELFFAVFLGLLADLGGRLDALSAAGLPPKELLRAAAVTLISHLERNRDFIERFRAGQFADSRSHKKFSAARAENLGRITRIISLCSEGGLLDSRDASYEASALFGLCRSGMMNNLITGRALTVSDRADRVLHILLNGIGKK